MNKKIEVEFFFREPRLLMTLPERIIFRIFSYTFYCLLIASFITLIIFQPPKSEWIIIVLFLFLAERTLNFDKAKKNLLTINPQKKRLQNSALFLTPKSLNIIESSIDKALISNQDFSFSFFNNLIFKKEIFSSLKRLEIPLQEFSQKVSQKLQKNPSKKESRQEIIKKIEKIINSSAIDTLKSRSPFIEPMNILNALLDIDAEKFNDFLQSFSLSKDDFKKANLWSKNIKNFGFLKKVPSSIGGFIHNPYYQRSRSINRSWTSRPTPTLDKYSDDLTALARGEQIGLLIGHQKEYDEMEDVLSQPSRPNVLLIGESGSGKNTLLSHLAFRIIKDEVPPALFDKRLISLKIGSLIAGAPDKEVQKRIHQIIEEITASKNIILLIENIHNILKTQSPGGITIADSLIPLISSSAFSTIGSTFPKELKEYIEKNSDFESSFSKIRVEEISKEEAEVILVFESIVIENLHKNKIIVTIPAIKKAVKIASQFFSQEKLPGSASKLLKEASADAFQNKEKLVSAKSIIKIAERKVNIPLHETKEEEKEKLLNLEDLIHQKLINQKEAVRAVSSSLRRYRSGLSESGGPIASFLFVGPTGVGKTELSKILAEIQFGSRKEIIRLDMSEFQDKQSFFRLIGSPDGKIIGSLTEAISQKPYSLVLLDEFEKSHPDILNLFLQVLDDGRLTDNFGRTVSFENTIIIATSNANSEFIKEQIDSGIKVEDIAENLKKKLTAYFKPELLNRFSRIIVFRSLLPNEIEDIARLKINSFSKRMKEEKSISILFSEEVISKIAKLGFDPSFGARPLNKSIDTNLKDPLSEEILKENIKNGDKIEVIIKENDIIFKKI